MCFVEFEDSFLEKTAVLLLLCYLVNWIWFSGGSPHSFPQEEMRDGVYLTLTSEL